MTVNVKMDSTTHTLLEDSDFKTKLLNLAYPIGTVYSASFSDITPSRTCPIQSNLGGTWVLTDYSVVMIGNGGLYLNCDGGASIGNTFKASSDSAGGNARFVNKVRYFNTPSSSFLGQISTWVRTA